MSLNEKLVQVGVISSCNMLKVGIESLLTNEGYQCCAMPIFNAISDADQYFVSNVPDVLIITVQLYHSDINSIIDFIKSKKYSWPEVKIVVMLDVHVICVIQRLLTLDIQGLISLRIAISEWQDIFHKVINGAIYYCAAIESIVRPISHNYNQVSLLSKNENCVLGYLLAGYSITMSATLMSRAKKTVASQKINAMKKLGLTHYSQLVAVRSMLNI